MTYDLLVKNGRIVPNNGWRIRELAEGIHCTVVNGEVLMEKGAHTGSHPGRVLTNARYQMSR